MVQEQEFMPYYSYRGWMIVMVAVVYMGAVTVQTAGQQDLDRKEGLSLQVGFVL